ncbi:hypothetical protein C8F01DRAFT_993691 [Mycena amicta]|nr:hypothetical protein C8F01DRAFT_993691 [Mycena amicta]
MYFGDVPSWFPADDDDINLGGVAMSHIEHADDLAIFSTTREGLQRRLHYLHCFARWCSANSMVISVQKTQWMVFGPLPPNLPPLYVNGSVVAFVEEYKFIGIWFTSVKRHIFAKHYLHKASKARGLARACFTVNSKIGSMPVKEGLQLYKARVDPHLISGCEVVLDVDKNLASILEEPQKQYLRRLLGLRGRSMRAVLFTETGLLPISYRRAMLALRFAAYLVRLPDHHYSNAAYREALLLAANNMGSWITDLRAVLLSFEVFPVSSTVDDFRSSDGITELVKAVERSADRFHRAKIANSDRLRFLRKRQEIGGDAPAMQLRPYLQLVSSPNRKAYTKFLTSEHSLAVEALRLPERYRMEVPRAWCLCRFCHRAVEDETHATLVCTAHSSFTPRRAAFLHDVFALRPHLAHIARTRPASELLDCIMLDKSLVGCTARYLRDVLDVYDATPVWIPPGFRRH